jgi:hypothetical protein
LLGDEMKNTATTSTITEADVVAFLVSQLTPIKGVTPYVISVAAYIKPDGSLDMEHVCLHAKDDTGSKCAMGDTIEKAKCEMAAIVRAGLTAEQKAQNLREQAAKLLAEAESLTE